jgi:uroporphyrinogen decarboxylase
MNPRERYLCTLLFQAPDKVPFEPGRPRKSTLERWRREGLPAKVDWFRYLCGVLGIAPGSADDPWGGCLVNFRMNPTFEEKTLEHRGGHLLVQDWMGNIVEISEEYDFTYLRDPVDFVTRKWHAFVVSNPQDFEAKIKWRYNPEDPSRYPPDFEELAQELKGRDFILTMTIPGPFWQLRDWCGFESLCIMFAEQPDFVREMLEFWCEFVSRTMARVLDAGIVDRLWINEDMAYKSKSMISPRMVREFLQPVWSRWAREAREAGVRLIDEDSDGYVAELIPIWIESGINVCDPLEVAAGNDIVAYRRQFGRRMAFRQGIDKRAIAKGGEAIQLEIARIEPVVRDGGYIPGCDHGVPPDISWEDFVHYSRLLAEITGWL